MSSDSPGNHPTKRSIQGWRFSPARLFARLGLGLGDFYHAIRHFAYSFRPTLRLSQTFFAMTPKVFLAYSAWVWTEMALQIFAMLIFLYFWRAIYANAGQETLSGLELGQTLSYVLLARIIGPALESGMIFNFGSVIREGMIGIELLRPVDYQWRSYLEQTAFMMMQLLVKTPLILIALLFFGLHLPTDPAVWGAFIVALLLGHAVLFCFDWLYACLAFYSTETWGLGVVREAVALLFSGALLPLVMFPDWLRSITNMLPFAQVIYTPIALLSGILPPSQAPALWLTQLAWAAGLLLASRLFFNFSVRKVTVQGG
jgi:ABC-2 type transport system permease protein